MIAEADLDGTPITTTTFDTVDSGMVQTGAYVGDDLWIGGTEGWVQNPSGRSVFEPGQPLLARLRPGMSVVASIRVSTSGNALTTKQDVRGDG